MKLLCSQVQGVGRQLARFIVAERDAGRRHTRNTLEQLKPENLSRQDVRAGLAWLEARGLLRIVPMAGDNGKRPASGARYYLDVDEEPRRTDKTWSAP